jgi:hypothetical protein
MEQFDMRGTWKLVDSKGPLLTDGSAQLHSPENAIDDPFGIWRIERPPRLVQVLDIPPVPGARIEVLREGAKEAIPFKVIECTKTTLTLGWKKKGERG